jgi:glycosyltransferase involved in cell wall biosynthesis
VPAGVSVVVPVRDGAPLLPQTLAAVAAQVPPPAEVIVVDDGSRDGSAAVAQRVLPTVRVLRREASGGVSDARNAGLALSTQPFVCFLDHDDLWPAGHLARQLAAFARHPEAGAVVCPYHHWHPSIGTSAGIYPEPAAVWARFAGPEHEDADFTGWVYHQFLLDCWALMSATMIRREAIEQVGAFDAARSRGEDWELWLRLSRRWPFVKLHAPPVLYRQHPGQATRRAGPADERSELLIASAREHGLASRDGRAVPRAVFERRLARYRMEFGVLQLMAGNAALGRRVLWEAWRRDPLQPRYLALAAAAAVGWRPRHTV